jgi:hypothetical protein
MDPDETILLPAASADDSHDSLLLSTRPDFASPTHRVNATSSGTKSHDLTNKLSSTRRGQEGSAMSTKSSELEDGPRRTEMLVARLRKEREQRKSFVPEKNLSAEDDITGGKSSNSISARREQSNIAITQDEWEDVMDGPESEIALCKLAVISNMLRHQVFIVSSWGV